ncbi:hypothetical protein ABIE89_000339 [Bradyrhizobium niftali]|uniref:hypothetical protein n=1 Tax=Bradyrhizobium niftali TaxID=2560055 RepID=UPI0038336A07
MAALAKLVSNLSGVNIEVETLKELASFSALGLIISLVCALTYGLDLSSGLF